MLSSVAQSARKDRREELLPHDRHGVTQTTGTGSKGGQSDTM